MMSVFKYRMKTEDLLSLIDSKRDRLVELNKEEATLQEELILLLQEATLRGINAVNNERE